MTKLEYALEASRRGFAILPLYPIKNGVCTCRKGKECKSPGKHPLLLDWPNSSTKDEKQIKQWWNQTPEANIGIATGEKSGIVVVDLDSQEAIEEYKKQTNIEDITKDTYTVKTGRGYHLYYRSEIFPNRKDILDKMEVQGAGAYVVGPGSQHITGITYSVVSDIEPANLPEYIIRATKNSNSEKLNSEDWKAELPKSTRNVQLTRRIGSLIRMGIEPSEVYIMAMALNETKCNPPLESAEVKKIVKSLYNRHKEKALKEKQEEEEKKKNAVMQSLDTREFVQEYSEEPIEWVIKDFLPNATIGICAAPPGSFKTWMLLALAYAVSTGEKFLDIYDVNMMGNVLFIQQEDDYSMLVTRLMRVMKFGHYSRNRLDTEELLFPRRELPNIYWHTEEDLHFKDLESLNRLENLIKEKNIRLVIIDPLYSAVDMKDYMLDSAQQILKLKKMRKKYKTSFMIATHTTKKLSDGRKRDDIYGSIFLNAVLETGWQLRLRGGEEGAAVITMERHFKSQSNPADVDLLLEIDSTGFYPKVIDATLENGDIKEIDGVSELDFMEKPPRLDPVKFTEQERLVYDIIFYNRNASMGDITKISNDKVSRGRVSQIVTRFEELGLIIPRGPDRIYRFREETFVFQETEENRAKYEELIGMVNKLKLMQNV